jgi:hypothetical protein
MNKALRVGELLDSLVGSKSTRLGKLTKFKIFSQLVYLVKLIVGAFDRWVKSSNQGSYDNCNYLQLIQMYK